MSTERQGEMIEKGDTIKIKLPTKKEPDRVVEAYVFSIYETPGEPRWLRMWAKGKKVHLYENSDKIIDPSPTSHSQASEDEK